MKFAFLLVSICALWHPQQIQCKSTGDSTPQGYQPDLEANDTTSLDKEVYDNFSNNPDPKENYHDNQDIGQNTQDLSLASEKQEGIQTGNLSRSGSELPAVKEPSQQGQPDETERINQKKPKKKGYSREDEGSKNDVNKAALKTPEGKDSFESRKPAINPSKMEPTSKAPTNRRNDHRQRHPAKKAGLRGNFKKNQPSRQFKRSLAYAASPVPKLGESPLPDEENLPTKNMDTDKSLTVGINEGSSTSEKSTSPIRRSTPGTQENEKSTTSRHLPVAKRGLSGGDSKEVTGTTDYERWMARRREQLDKLEGTSVTKPKSLPQRLKQVSGSFDEVAHLLNDNIKSVSAINQEKITSNRKSSPRALPGTSDGSGEDGQAIKRGTGNNCPCYDKYSPLNVVRHTAKKVNRAIKHLTNAVFDGMDTSLAYSKDVKDAVRNDLIDPAVNLVPVVSPAIGKVLDAGDVVVDGSIDMARGAVQGYRSFNNRWYEGVENIFYNKGKTCPCEPDTQQRDLNKAATQNDGQIDNVNPENDDLEYQLAQLDGLKYKN